MPKKAARTTDDTHGLSSVFTPSSANPELNFVPRGQIEKDLQYHLLTLGRPICIEGPLRCGKTSLVLKGIRDTGKEIIHTVCNQASTFDGLIVSALQALTLQWLERKTSKPPAERNVGLELIHLLREADSKPQAIETSRKRGDPKQVVLSATLGRCMVDANAVWIVDDAHKLPTDEFEKLARAMREWQTMVFKSKDAKIVVVASDVGKTRAVTRLIEFAPDLAQRVISLRLAMMSPEELLKIVQRGEDLLNLDMSAIYKPVRDYSNGVPGICHDLCSLACFEAGVAKTQPKKLKISQGHFASALRNYASNHSATIQEKFKSAERDLGSIACQGFYSSVLNELAALELNKGVALGRLTEDLVSSLGIDAAAVGRGLARMVDENDGVLRIDGTTDILSFREPLYREIYKHQVGEESELGGIDELVSALTEVLGRQP